jgi:nickel/cobalt transporter (NiCoT) family protein
MAGMTLVDSVDSILMLFSYAGFPARPWTLFERSLKSDASNFVVEENIVDSEAQRDIELKPESLNATVSLQTASDKPEPEPSPILHQASTTDLNATHPTDISIDSRVAAKMRAKMNVMSGLSIILTLMSILVAFR